MQQRAVGPFSAQVARRVLRNSDELLLVSGSDGSCLGGYEELPRLEVV